jgi:DNA-binding CsgD family transcriptional regulator
MTPRRLRRELAAGLTLQQIARQQGGTYAQVRAAILARLRARAGRGLR